MYFSIVPNLLILNQRRKLSEPRVGSQIHPVLNICRFPNSAANWTLPITRGVGRLFQDMMTKNKQRNWRRFLAGCLVAVVVLGLVIAATVLLTGSPDSSGSRAPLASGISLEEWLAGSLSPKSFNGTWITGKYIYIYFFFNQLDLTISVR